MPTALTRRVSPSIIHCELTHLERRPIDYPNALRQHAAYEACLEALGCRVQQLPGDPGMPTAITRAVSPGIIHYELTHLERRPIDYLAAVNQHVAYETCLERLGYRVQQLPTTPEMPDSVFIEDTALVLEEVAVITRPGAASRRSETAAVADVLAGYRPVCFITPPGTLDGGDILRLGIMDFIVPLIKPLPFPCG